MMDRDFFIKLVFGTHKVADLLTREGKEGSPASAEASAGKQLKAAANILLSDLLLICEENPVTLEQKKNVLPRTLRGIGEVQRILGLAKEASRVNPAPAFPEKSGAWVNPKNFAILEQEYKKIPDLLVEFFVAQNLLSETKEEGAELPKPGLGIETKPGLGFEEDVPKPDLGVSPKPGLKSLSPRQERILEFLKSKEKAQVWELQKMLPEPITKRTLRRDMDYLMQQGKVERQGEWNGVFYKLTR